jgi:NAD(P)H-dependent FMN reductase
MRRVPGPLRTPVATTQLLLVSGSLRAHSTNTAVLETAAHLAPAGVVTMRFTGLGRLPHFDPDADRDPLDPRVAELRRQIHAADALMFSTPEYAGALPGSFKNLLDWTIGDDQPGSIAEKPVAWINASPREARHAHESLRRVLEFAHAVVVDAACAHVPVTAADIGADGLVADPSARATIATVVTKLAEYVRRAGPRRSPCAIA